MGMRGLWIVLCLAAWPLHALQLELPRAATATASRDSTLDQIDIPVGPFADGSLATRQFEGAVTRRAYRINTPGLTPLQLLAPLRTQVEAAGFDLVLDCNQNSCGGYDFRFAIDVLPAPNMYVNIRAFHFVTGLHPTSGEAITLLASAAGSAGYLQVVRAGGGVTPAPVLPAPPVSRPRAQEAADSLSARLLAQGSVVLHDIEFAVGTTSLDGQTSSDLSALADLMAARPGLRVAVVGHTDTVGGLEANITVSRARAQSVRNKLISDYGVSAERVEAEGMGYLAPRASNLTAEGREANRRVEVIVVGEGE
ncbi:OmpA family protein [uncultured Tateyamaria sp.]|uniref:OmpA family protein n=1 Tax=uncultured Tateyamaria sp. TaxID=455651 RepID=UPI0026205C80|nr:OmpA family protein [uncultured Tateyamaria sp.]